MSDRSWEPASDDVDNTDTEDGEISLSQQQYVVPDGRDDMLSSEQFQDCIHPLGSRFPDIWQMSWLLQLIIIVFGWD